MAAIALIFFERTWGDYRKMCPVRPSHVVSTRRRLYYIAVVACVSGSPKIFLDTGLVADVMLLFPGHHFHLTWILIHSVELNSLQMKVYTQNLRALANFSAYFDAQNQSYKVWHIIMRHWIFRLTEGFETLNIPVIPPVFIILMSPHFGPAYVAAMLVFCVDKRMRLETSQH